MLLILTIVSEYEYLLDEMNTSSLGVLIPGFRWA